MQLQRLFPAILLLAVACIAHVDAHADPKLAARLSWSAVSSQSNLASSTGTNTLYVRIDHSLSGFQGATIDLKWNPPGDWESDCLSHYDAVFKTSQGTTCTYLNRGIAVPIPEIDTPGRLRLSWANSEAFTGCTAGVIVGIPFRFSGCLTQPVKFELCNLVVLNAAGGETSADEDSLGPIATFLGGGSYFEPCHVPPDSCTPVIAPLGDFFVASGQTLGITPWLVDTTCVVTWSGVNLPPGYQLDTESGLLTWQSGLEGEHYHDVTLIATASGGHADSVVFDIHVTPSDNTHFGIFQAAAEQDDAGRIGDIRAEWLNRTLLPLAWGLSETMQRADDIVTLAQERGLGVVFNLSTAIDDGLKAQWPPADTFTVQDWVTRVTALAARYNTGSDPAVQMPGLERSVDWWHIEEEASFWPASDQTGCDYVNEYKYTRSALLAGNYAVKTVVIGLSSDPTTAAAYFERQGTVLPALATDADPDTASPGFTIFLARAKNWLGTFQSACPLPWFDAVDFHSFERDDALKGKVQWVRSLIDGPPRQVWVNEAGGPAWDSTYHTADWDPPYAPAYHDTLNAGHVYRQFAEALANRVQRYSWQFYPPGPESPFFSPPGTMNQFSLVPLFRNPSPGADPPPYEAKRSDMAYKTLTHLLHNYKYAADRRLHDDGVLPWYTCPPESLAAGKCRSDCCPENCRTGATCNPACRTADSSCVQTIRGFANSDVTGVLNMEFWPADTTGLTQANVIWAGNNPVGRTDSVTVRFADAGTDSVWLYHIPTLETEEASPEVRVVSDSLVVFLGASPVIVAARRHFNAYQTEWRTTAVSTPESLTRNRLSITDLGELTLNWSVTRPRVRAMITIVDAAGRVVHRQSVDATHALNGSLTWDARRVDGSRVARGLYWARLTADHESLADARLLLVR